MLNTHSSRLKLLCMSYCAWLTFMPASATAQEYRETRVATHFQLYVPPNNDNGTRYSAIVVTALSGTNVTPCVVNLIDDAGDGDSDDTQRNVSMLKGQSLVRYIRDGAVNDDAGGKWDGDYVTVTSTQPVSVYLATDSDWQHDFAPSDNGTLRGTHFYLYANGYSVSQRDIDVFAFESDTRVQLFDITGTALSASGVTTLSPRPASALLLADLDEGEDLLVRHGLGRDLLARGRTYELVATKPVTVMFGAISSVTPQNQARDGGAFMPGRSGSTLDDDFYFHIPHNPSALNEQELRIVSFHDSVTARLYGWNAAASRFDIITNYPLNRLDHADYVGGSYELYRLRAFGGRVVAYEANWLETGSAGTSDEADFVSGDYSATGAQEFVVYLGPPGAQTNSVLRNTLVHVYLYSRLGQRNVRIVDADTLGTLFTRTVDIAPGGYADVSLTTAQFSALNKPAQGLRPYLRVASASPLSVMMSNWNDNWMAYATATVVRNPEVVLQADPDTLINASTVVHGTISNFGGTALSNVEVMLTLPVGLTYQSGTLDGTAETSVAATSTGTQVKFATPSLAQGAALDLTLQLRVAGEAGLAGEVISIEATVTASELSTPVASTTSAPLRLSNPTIASIDDLRVTNGDRQVTIRYDVSGSVIGTTSLVLQRSTQPASAFVAVSGSSTSYSGSVARSIEFIDTSVSNKQSYYYRVLASGADGSLAYAGPVLAQPQDVVPPPVPEFALVPGDARVTVEFPPSTAPDAVGIKISRRRSGTSAWTVLNAQPVAPPRYVDLGLSNGVTYEYSAVAVDDDGNPSPASAIKSVAPLSPPSRFTDRIVHYEDMIGSGRNDWDYNDFIVRIAVGETLRNGQLSRLVIDYEPLARGAGYIHEFHQSIALHGAYHAVLVRYDSAGAPQQTRTQDGVGSCDIVVFDETRKVLPAVVGSYTNTASTQTSYVAGGSARLIIETTASANADGSYGVSPFDPYIRMPYLRGANEVHLPTQGGISELASATSPVAGYALDFAFSTDTDLEVTWAFEGQPVWTGYPSHPSWVKQGLSPRWWSLPRSSSAVFYRKE